MDNYLVERATMEQFVDELFEKKQPLNMGAEELALLKEEKIRQLDKAIEDEVFGGLSEEDLKKLEVLLDDEATSEEAFDEFFRGAGVNVEEKIKTAMIKIAKEFLGGKNE